MLEVEDEEDGSEKIVGRRDAERSERKERRRRESSGVLESMAFIFLLSASTAGAEIKKQGKKQRI